MKLVVNMLRPPFMAVVAGPTGSGKTQFVSNLILHGQWPQRKVWGYGIWQLGYTELAKQGFEMVEGFPPLETFDPETRNVLVLDDLGHELSGDRRLASLFTRGSHHRNLSVVFIVQNLFLQGREMRNISLNSHYICLFKNPRDRSQVMHLGRQLFPKRPKFLQEAYEDATEHPFGYLWLDLKSDTPENLRILTNILPTDGQTFAYVQKK